MPDYCHSSPVRSAAMLVSTLLVMTPRADSIAQDLELTAEQVESAEANYQKYCALCHGPDRAGYANDHAPSLKSNSLFSSGPDQVWVATSYGRPDTPMGGYLDEVGGPMSFAEIWELVLWLHQTSGAERIELSSEVVVGDATVGRAVYAQECAECHGETGEGGIGTALSNRAFLATASDQFIRYAIANGRDGTPMPGFRDRLSPEKIDAVTSFLRSRASGWTATVPVRRSPPAPEDYVLNPDGSEPELELKDDLYVSSADLKRALDSQSRIVILDARVTSQWRLAHIEGAVPLPYYNAIEHKHTADLPRDVQIVVYCACPRAASEKVVKALREYGFSKTAVLYEGVLGWLSLGFPVVRGDIDVM